MARSERDSDTGEGEFVEVLSGEREVEGVPTGEIVAYVSKDVAVEVGKPVNLHGSSDHHCQKDACCTATQSYSALGQVGVQRCILLLNN